ncbi:hypothetical protein C1S82_13000 [Mycolicibacterium cosmeticum]|nr:hypothetical protein C1S82_13000 [Mycolicibacterium cosmeticum]
MDLSGYRPGELGVGPFAVGFLPPSRDGQVGGHREAMVAQSTEHLGDAPPAAGPLDPSDDLDELRDFHSRQTADDGRRHD